MFTRLAAPSGEIRALSWYTCLSGNIAATIGAHSASAFAFAEDDGDKFIRLVQVIDERSEWRCSSGNLKLDRSGVDVAESPAHVIDVRIAESQVLDNDPDGVSTAARAGNARRSLCWHGETAHRASSIGSPVM